MDKKNFLSKVLASAINERTNVQSTFNMLPSLRVYDAMHVLIYEMY